MRRVILGCLVFVILLVILVLILARCISREQELPPAPTSTLMPTVTVTRERTLPAPLNISPTADPSRTLTSLRIPTPSRTPTIDVPTAYDLYIRRQDYMRADPRVGQTILVFVMIATDTHPSGGPLFPATHFRWRKDARSPWQEESCPANMQYQQCSMTLTLSYAQPGDHIFEVEADNRHLLTESNENNNTKSWTITVKGQTGGQGQPPPAPTNCRTRIPTSGTGQIYIDWDIGATSPRDGFRIYQGRTSLEKTVGASEHSVLLTGLTAGVQYHFDVRAYNASGESRVDACAVDVTPPR